MRRPVIILLEK